MTVESPSPVSTAISRVSAYCAQPTTAARRPLARHRRRSPDSARPARTAPAVAGVFSRAATPSAPRAGSRWSGHKRWVRQGDNRRPGNSARCAAPCVPPPDRPHKGRRTPRRAFRRARLNRRKHAARCEQRGQTMRGFDRFGVAGEQRRSRHDQACARRGGTMSLAITSPNGPVRLA